MIAPAVVAIGGGHGLAATLRALRQVTTDITAVVSVADNGGSTGRLRATSDQPAPGDLRKCLVALSEADSALAQSMEYRFSGGELDGHALGNLLLAAMSEVTGGLSAALIELAALLGITGQVVPATVEGVELTAVTTDGRVVRGQVEVMGTRGIDRVVLRPADPEVSAAAVEAIGRADIVVLGPGSLYTSVLAATAAPAITRAIQESPATVVYICNLRPQESETSGYSVRDHVAALARHGIVPDVVLFDPELIGDAVGVEGAIAASLVAQDTAVHDPALLAGTIASNAESWTLRRRMV